MYVSLVISHFFRFPPRFPLYRNEQLWVCCTGYLVLLSRGLWHLHL